MDRFYDDIKKKMLCFDVVLVEGFLLFAEDRFDALFDVVIWLDIDLSTMKERRAKRGTYAGFWDDPPGYVENIVWPSYLHYHRNVEERFRVQKKPVLKLDSSKLTLSSILRSCFIHIFSNIPSNNNLK